MSLACFECDRGGSFNTLVIFEPRGKFDANIPVSHYANFYTDCACIATFKISVKKSRFMIVEMKRHASSWFTATDGDTLSETKFKPVDEYELKKVLPKIFAALTITEKR